MKQTEIISEFVKDAYHQDVRTHRDLQNLKNDYCTRYKVTPFRNIELVSAYRDLISKGELPDDREFWKTIRKRGIRSLAGITNITVLTKGFACPGKCIFCPTEPKMPKSYLSEEPAMMRAILNNFDAYRQTMNRLTSLGITGHVTDKVDVIVSGGTFDFYPKPYQISFIRGIYNALNYPQKRERSLEKAQLVNEKAKNRCIGLSVETRPDHITPAELKRFRKMGVTKIEIGVQSLDDEVLSLNRRGHGIKETKRAIKLIKDAGFKLNVHMMPNLLGSTPEKDLRDLKELFNNQAYRPDWMKVYPCVVVPWSQLEQIHKSGKYQSYSDEQLIELMVEMNKHFTDYVRVTRIYRDIPSTKVLSGCKITNLRQVVEQKMSEQGIVSRDIRSREIRGLDVDMQDLELVIDEYDASEGKEYFLHYEYLKADKICALLRLRFPSYHFKGGRHFLKELQGAAIIREVHTYGEQMKLQNKNSGSSQHIGLGKSMILKAEQIVAKAGFRKIAVISGVGVREYYRKLGYQLEGTYMVKYL